MKQSLILADTICWGQGQDLLLTINSSAELSLHLSLQKGHLFNYSDVQMKAPRSDGEAKTKQRSWLSATFLTVMGFLYSV